MKNLLSCNLVSYRGHTEKAYAHLPTLGIRHVEIGAPAPERATPVMAELARHGLVPATIQGFSDAGSDTIVDDFVGYCATARAMGVRVIFTSVHAGETPLEDVYARMRRVGDVAAEHGLMVAMETHPDLMTNGDVALRTLTAIGHPAVGMNFDTANIYYYNESTTSAAEVRKVAAHVVSVHLKDSNGRPRAWDFPTLGRGVVDFPAIIGILNDEGFTGPFTMELEGVEGQQFSAEEAAEDVASSVAYLRSIAEFE
jgi:L-ribulose-5-phosphate 3-epimerase